MNDLVSLVMQISGLFIVLAILAQVALALFAAARRAVYAREQHHRALDLLDHQIESARQHRIESELEALSWQGFRKFEVAKKVDEGGGIQSFYFSPHDDRPLPAFKPGQFLTFKLYIPGEKKPTTRCYSLSSSVHEGHYRCSIKRVRPPPSAPDAPPGKASSHLHIAIQEHDIVDVKAPAGNFFLDVTKTTPIVLIGGGIGITPVLCMLEAVVAHGVQRDVWLFYGIRNSSEHIMKDHLASLARDHRRLRLQVCYSEPLEDDRKDEDYQHHEYVSVDLFQKVLPSSNYEFYICGPPPMMESLVKGLKEWGVPDEAVHYEAFGPASVKKAAPAVQSEASGFKVTFHKSAKEIAWTAADGSLLECAEANGIAIDAGCRAGNCGTCLTAVRSGEVDYLNEPGERPESGSCLVCVGVPTSDLVLDV